MARLGIFIESLQGGGAERIVSILSRKLPTKFEKVILLKNTDNMKFDYEGKLIDLKSNYKNVHSNLGKLATTFFEIIPFLKVRKDLRLQCTLSLLISPNIMNVLTKGKGKSIVSVHSFAEMDIAKVSLFMRAYIFLLKHADCIIVVAELMRQRLIHDFKVDPKLVRVIHNPVEIQSINQLKSNQLEGSLLDLFQNPVVINVGSLNEQKAQIHLIRAFYLAKTKVKNLKLVILGQGALEGDLKKAAVELDIAEDVHFLGYQQNPFQFIACARMFVLSSVSEGFGNVLIEAMACGVPVISTDCRCGPREILAPQTDANYETRDIEYAENGILVPVCKRVPKSSQKFYKEEKLMAKAILALQNKPALANNYAKKSLLRAKDFDADKIVAQYASVIEETISKI